MPPIVIIHSACAFIALVLGASIFIAQKGTTLHRRVGWVYIVFLGIVSLSALFIQDIRPGAYSLVHLFVPFTLLSLVYAIFCIYKLRQTGDLGWRKRHARAMVGVYLGGLLLAGALTILTPGRVLYRLLFEP